ncbi:Organelle RRM domain-containing protein 2, mitochondrial [Dionaea muscipula]
MAMRAVAGSTATAAASRGLTRLFSTFSFIPPPQPQQAPAPPPAEPSTNLFVSGLSKQTTTEGLRKAFEAFGEVVHAKVVTDRVSGYSKGFGFVRYATMEQAAAGIQGMDGKFLDGWVIFAEYARPRPPLPNNENPPYGGTSPFGGNHSYGQR